MKLRYFVFSLFLVEFKSSIIAIASFKKWFFSRILIEIYYLLFKVNGKQVMRFELLIIKLLLSVSISDHIPSISD
jgi:hypothetical protein